MRRGRWEAAEVFLCCDGCPPRCYAFVGWSPLGGVFYTRWLRLLDTLRDVSYLNWTKVLGPDLCRGLSRLLLCRAEKLGNLLSIGSRSGIDTLVVGLSCGNLTSTISKNEFSRICFGRGYRLSSDLRCSKACGCICEGDRKVLKPMGPSLVCLFCSRSACGLAMPQVLLGSQECNPWAGLKVTLFVFHQLWVSSLNRRN